MVRYWLSVLILVPATLVFAELRPGDVAVVAYNTEGADSFAWVALRDMPPGTQIHFTSACVSNGWFRWGDHLGRPVGPGPLTWTATNLVRAGTVVSWISSTQKCWSVGAISGGVPALNSSGDQIFAYTGIIAYNAAGTAPWLGDPAQARLLFGLNFGNAGWDNVAGGNLSTSYIPAGLSEGEGTAVHVGSHNNAYYGGERSGTAGFLLNAIAKTNHWVSSVNSINVIQWPSSFDIRPAGTYISVK